MLLPTPDGKNLMVEVSAGEQAEEFAGFTYAAEGSLAGVVLGSGRAELIQDVTTDTRWHVYLSDYVAIGPLMARFGGQDSICSVSPKRRFPAAAPSPPSRALHDLVRDDSQSWIYHFTQDGIARRL